MLLYSAYQAQSDALAPLRLFADAARGLLDQPWLGIGDLPVVQGTFGLDDEIELIIDWIRRLGPGIHLMAVCQPSVPVLAAVSLMAAAGDPCRPRSMVLMGGPIDPEANPTEVNRFAESHSL